MDMMLENLNALAGGLFLLCSFAMVATRQVRGCLRMFIFQGLLLAASAFLLSALLHSWHVFAVGVINLISKPLLIPWVLRRTLGVQINARREIDQVLNIPSSLLIALVLAIGAYFMAAPLIAAGAGQHLGLNLAIGLAGLLIGAYTATVRREGVPLLLGLLAMENSAFLAGIAIAPSLPLIAELAIVSDVLILAFIVGVLTRTLQQRAGTTRIGELAALKEEPHP